jgi:hypothetical protein
VMKDSHSGYLVLLKIQILTKMKKSSIYVLATIFFALGAVVSYYVVSNKLTNSITEQKITIDSLQTQIVTLSRQNNVTFEQRESRPIPADTALYLINNYNCGQTTLKDSDNVVLKGWHIEKHLIEKLFNTYRNEGVTGIQVYLGKHNEGSNTSHTLIWMACKEIQEVRNGRDTVRMELLINKDSTIYQYVKPCPINCPRNDFAIDCD